MTDINVATQLAADRRRILLKLETLWNKWDSENMNLGLLVESLLYVKPMRAECDQVKLMSDEEIEAKLDTLIGAFGLKVSGGWKS